jgi:hypothetical protein
MFYFQLLLIHPLIIIHRRRKKKYISVEKKKILVTLKKNWRFYRKLQRYFHHRVLKSSPQVIIYQYKVLRLVFKSNMQQC